MGPGPIYRVRNSSMIVRHMIAASIVACAALSGTLLGVIDFDSGPTPTHIDAPGLKLVVDTCIGNDKARQSMGDVPLQTPFLEHLAEAGFSRADVDVVICTHLHFDHVGWNTMLLDGRWVPTFPKARYLFARGEYEHWKDAQGADILEQGEVLSDSIRPVFEAGLATLVEPDHRISPEIKLMPTPGHTPGHVGVVIESEGKTAIITGDMMHHPCQIARPGWSTHVDCDKAQASTTRRHMLAGGGLPLRGGLTPGS